MEFVAVAAIVAVSFGAAATWLLATRPEHWLDKSASNGRYAHLGLQNGQDAEPDPRRDQARVDARRVRRARVRARLQGAARVMRALRPAAARHGHDRPARP